MKNCVVGCQCYGVCVISYMVSHQISVDTNLVEKHGLEGAVLIGMLRDPEFLLSQGRKSGFAQAVPFDYPWNIRKVDGRVWYGFSNADLEVLAPFWNPNHTRNLLEALAKNAVFDTQQDSNDTYYSFRD